MDSVAKIAVDIFSGRPNPSFELRGRKLLHLVKLLALPRRPLDAPFPEPALGFRGVVVRLEPSGREFRLLDGFIAHGGAVYTDPEQVVLSYVVSVLPRATRALLTPLIARPRRP